MAVGDLYQLTIMGRLHGQRILNVLHYGVSVAGPTNPIEDLVTQWRADCETHWLACHSNEYTLDGYLSQKIRPLPITASYEEAPLALAGSSGNNSLPTSMAVVLTKRTDLAGRSYRGRIYMAGVPITFELDSELTGAAMNVYDTLADDLESPIVTAGGTTFIPVLFRRSADVAREITQVIPRSTLRNQRRRQVGRGI